MGGKGDTWSGIDRLGEIPQSTQATSSAVGWSFVMNGARLASTLGTAFVLASLLGPRAFGTVALALIFVTLVQTLVQQGFIPAIVQFRGLTWRHLDSAFWLSIAMSLVLAAGCVAASGWWAEINGTPEARDPIRVLSGLIVVKGLIVVHEGYLQRELRYRDLAVRTALASVAGAVVGIAWAVARPSIWALVAQHVVAAVVALVITWTVVEWRPRFGSHRSDVNDLAGFAAKSTASSIGVFVSTRVDAILIGLFFGATAIGLYQLSFRLMQSAIEVTVYPISGVALADLARRQSDPEELARRYLTLVGAAAAIGAPVMATIFASAGPLMATVGDDWAPAVPALRLLCVVGIVTVIGMVNSPALQAVGRPGVQAWIVWLGAAVSAVTFTIVGSLLVGSPTATQVTGMAASRAAVYAVLLLPLSQLLVSRHLDVSVGRFVRAVLPAITVAVIAAAVGLLVQLPLEAADAPTIVVLGIVGACTLGLAVTLLLAIDANARAAGRIFVRRGQSAVRAAGVRS